MVVGSFGGMEVVRGELLVVVDVAVVVELELAPQERRRG
jgi:hypothetical protein